jgi:hypothetical protein
LLAWRLFLRGGALAERLGGPGNGRTAWKGRDLGLRILGGVGLVLVVLMILWNVVRIVRLLFPPGR